MGSAFPPYDPASLERGWPARWQAQGLFRATEDEGKPKFYCLDFFPYPSGESLSVGHCRNYVPTDVVSRFHRMRGRNVLHPMGWDAFGEPAELHAVAQGVHPRQTIDRNADHYRRQLDLVGDSIDWSREVDSSDPRFYRWTQWFFLLLYRRGLAGRDHSWQWWCPVCQTTLSNHEAQDGLCWRGHRGLTKKRIPAWYFRITAYADDLLAGLDTIDWPPSIKAMQANWIGRAEGARIRFLAESGQELPVFTTRPDTLAGVTFLALAPEQPLVEALTRPERSGAVAAYVEQARRRSEVERTVARAKSGVFTGSFALNPLTGGRLPLWVADYVLPGFGTGAVMGVPAHDDRDRAFAAAHRLGVVDAPPVARDVGQREGWAEPAVSYRMRDWLISRQRYWGAPIPIVYCPDHGQQALPEDRLPVELPPMADFLPDGSGRSPLARAADWVRTTCPVCGGPAERETDTMGGFACSSWYFLRFASPDRADAPFDPARARYWMPVDLYVGGAEHAVMHLLYARFWTRVMHDAGLVPFREPFATLRNQGQLLVRTPHRRALDPAGEETLVPVTPEEAARLPADQLVDRAGRMSKSLKNVITPDEAVARHGADALRAYVLFMAPFDQDVEWSEAGIAGVLRFLRRAWELVGRSRAAGPSESTDDELARLRHRAVRRATREIEELRFNTLVAGLMELANALEERRRAGRAGTAAYREALRALVLMLAPVAPFLAEGLWQLTGGFGLAAPGAAEAGDAEAPFGPAGSVCAQPWPTWDEALARETLVTVAVQVNGRARDRVDLPPDASEAEALAAALARPRVRARVPQPERARTIYVPGRVLNILPG
jgi:leucyl-tRNA synthetase